MALLGPLFGAPGAAARALGANEQQVAASNEVGGSLMGVAMVLSGLPISKGKSVWLGPDSRVASKLQDKLSNATGRGVKIIGSENSAAVRGGGARFTYNSVENPGPLAFLPGAPAANFPAGKYNADVLTDDIVLYRGGEFGKPLGQWFTRAPPESRAQVRIDSAVKVQWIDPKNGYLTGSSPVDTVYAIKIPKGTTIYEGPVGYQGGIHLGGQQMSQIFVETPWSIRGVEVLSAKPLK